MGEPVIIDDGGSTRIKQLVDNQDMDGLLGKVVNGQTTFTDNADGTFDDGGGNFRCSLKIRFHNREGEQDIRPPAGQGQAAGLNLQANDSVKITSENGQIVTINFDGTNRLVITLSASVLGINPIVEAKQTAAQRRYVVSNAGPIKTVDHTRASVTTNLFTNNANAPSVYTMVHFRDKDKGAP
jgi:hypothetical protein